MSEERVPCVEGLFSEENGVAVLHGSKCSNCQTPYFPRSAACHNPDCDDSNMEDFDFGGKGVLWSYSVADFPPPPPHKFDQPFVPYVMGVVDLDCGLRLIAQMVEKPEEVKVDAQVQLIIDTLYHEDGKALTTWKFKQI
ncbi:Zn-ribbon domain-containing OB-fold protein [Pseudohalioglobus lutimaris]|uniref:Benzoylsuccinyl-CoA thiolase n=1 Tax=Pseudohalioglobus lutimaris TaxID=1737061 RepID=A0A2N5X3Y5_9GAMM|nr:OB-fold domain-containing protein [Pseudohalioglobus lutimaris]PLW69183.1 hypothetical protein C0039_08970 [Pseudohalioglobus lutimaris]